MARSRVSGAAALLIVAAFAWPASACEGTEIVFEDKFADDAGGWAINQDVEIKDGRVSGLTQILPDTFNPASSNMPPMEDVSFVFHTIIWTITDGGLTHEDKWSEAR